MDMLTEQEKKEIEKKVIELRREVIKDYYSKIEPMLKKYHLC